MRPSNFFNHLTERSSDILQQLPGAAHDELQIIRSCGFTRFKMLGLPTLRDEAWKYTNVRALGKVPFKPVTKRDSDISDDDLNALLADSIDASRVVLLDGWLAEEYSNLNDLEDKVEIISLATILRGRAEVEPELEKYVLSRLNDRALHGKDGLATLNSALVADGVVIRVKQNATVARPLEILCVSSRKLSQQLSNINLFLWAESNSKISIIERYAALGESKYLTNSSFSFRLENSAAVDHYRIQNESNHAFHVGLAKINQAEKSQYRIYSLSFGASLDRHEVDQSLDGEESHCELKGLSLGTGRQHIDNYTTVSHAAPNGTSDEYYKSILDDRARSVFHGRIKVAIDSQHTDAQQQNKNLLLSKNAEADTMPQLEIYADDVKCSHGATVGQLDESAVFYLRTRGLNERQARIVLTRAFAAEIVEAIEHQAIREQVECLVQNKLGDNFEGQKAA